MVVTITAIMIMKAMTISLTTLAIVLMLMDMGLKIMNIFIELATTVAVKFTAMAQDVTWMSLVVMVEKEVEISIAIAIAIVTTIAMATATAMEMVITEVIKKASVMAMELVKGAGYGDYGFIDHGYDDGEKGKMIGAERVKRKGQDTIIFICISWQWFFNVQSL